MGGTSITKTTTSYTQEEIRTARSTIGPKGDAAALGAKLQENRSTQAATTQKNIEQSKTNNSLSQGSKESAVANLRNKVKSSPAGSSKRTFYEDLLSSVEGTGKSSANTLDRTSEWMVNEVKSLNRTSDYISGAINGSAANVTNAISGATAG